MKIWMFRFLATFYAIVNYKYINIMRKKNLLSLLFLLPFFFIKINAQMTCTPTDFNDITIMNSSGGTNTTDGLKIQISGAGNLQIHRNNLLHIVGADNLQPGNPNEGPQGGILLVIGQDVYGTSPYLFPPAGNFMGYIQPVSSTCTTTGNTYEHAITFSITNSTLVYGLKVTYSYTYPNYFFTVKYDVTIPPSNTKVVKLSQGWNDYMLVGFGDQGAGFLAGSGSNLTVGAHNIATNGERLYQAFKYKSGKAWDGYYSALADDSMRSDLATNQFIFSKQIDPSPFTNNGLGISINYGSTAGTFSTTSDFIFKCNSPTVEPSFSSTDYTIACGSTVNLKSQYTGTPEASLPAGVTLVFYDPSGNQIADPTAVSTPGTYNVFYSDANNAGCTSPSTTLTVTGGSCCSTAPALTANTITNTCPTETVNLNSLYSGSLPTGVTLEWYTNATHTGTPVANPTAVAIAGTYYAFIHDTATACFSPASVAVTFTKTTCCSAGTVAPVIN